MGPTRDLTVGRRIGYLTITKDLGMASSGHRIYECSCACGQTVRLRAAHLYPTRIGCTRSCPLVLKHKSVDLVGRKLGRWTVVRPSPVKPKNGRGAFWDCVCVCGFEQKIPTWAIIGGNTQGCKACSDKARSKGRTPEQFLADRRMACRDYARRNASRVKSHKIRYLSQMERATPKWLTDEDWKAMDALYAEARAKSRETGIRHEVDHVIPLYGKTVSGLHVPSNLQILTQAQNVAKSNMYAELLGD